MSVKRARLEEALKELEDELWPELEAEFGELISSSFRKLMRQQVIIRDTEDCLNNMDGDPDGKAELIESIKVSIRERWEAAKAYTASYFGQPIGTAPPKPRKIYRKCFERRLHLLDFVLKQKGRIRKRANWKAITAAWNKAHPFDTMDLPVLKVAFYHALKDGNVLQNYVAITIGPAFEKLAHNTIDFWHQHPEAKDLNELCEIEEAQL
jgi:hypothetical protein